MKRLVALVVVIGFAMAVTGCATPQPSVYAYPAKGQSAERVSQDQNECQAWAKQQTGFDRGTDTAKVAGVGLLVGALGGAAAGAAIGAAPGHAGTGAAIGAAGGGGGGAGGGGGGATPQKKDGEGKS